MERPLVKEVSINYILRKAAELLIDLRGELVRNDPHELSVLPRMKFWQILIGLPLGLNEDELLEVFENDLSFDNYGNVDYTSILNKELFQTLEAKRIRELALSNAGQKRKKLDFNSAMYGDAVEEQDEMKLADTRKVVVEDLIFIDDLEMLIYSTVSPKTSTIFVTSLQKHKVDFRSKQKQENVQYVDLADVGSKNYEELQQLKIQREVAKTQENDVMTNHYKLIAKLRGHKNSDPPSICYIPQSNCLVSAEKSFETEDIK